MFENYMGSTKFTYALFSNVRDIQKQFTGAL